MAKHISIVPLIGGMAIGAEQALGRPPEAVFSYDAFKLNDSFLMAWYEKRGLNIPYISLDQHPDYEPSFGEIDLVTSVCPCSGLSGANSQAGAGCQQNYWMTRSTEWVLDKIKPRVLIGENAPRLFGHFGQPVAVQLKEIGERFGYSMTLVKTSTHFHGLPQKRERSFFLFFRDVKIPALTRDESFYEGHWTEFLSSFEDDDSNGEYHQSSIHDALWNILVERTGRTREEIRDEIREKKRSIFVELAAHQPEARDQIIEEYLDGEDQLMHRIARSLKRTKEKMEISGCCNVWDDSPRFSKNEYYPAVMYKNIYATWHPNHMRPITPREQMRLMGLPEDMDIPRKYLNAIAQNVPTCTARWMVREAVSAEEMSEGLVPLTGDGIYRFNNLNGKHQWGLNIGPHLQKWIDGGEMEFTPVEETVKSESRELVTA